MTRPSAWMSSTVFLERAFEPLPEGGRVGFILPAYAFQTAGRVVEYADRWSLAQEMIPRNIFPGLSIPLVFARFFKDLRRVLIGFALYREADDIQRLSAPYREALRAPSGSSWRNVVEIALRELGGEGSLGEIYAKIEGKRPSRTQHWKEKVRQTLRRYADSFEPKGTGITPWPQQRDVFLKAEVLPDHRFPSGCLSLLGRLSAADQATPSKAPMLGCH